MCSRDSDQDPGGQFSVIHVSQDRLSIANGRVPAAFNAYDQIDFFDATTKSITTDYCTWQAKEGTTLDADYFGPFSTPQPDSGFHYIEINEVIAPADAFVVGVSFYQRGNRIAPRLWCTKGTSAKPFSVDTAVAWGKPGDLFADYQHYCDTNAVLIPQGTKMCGIKLYPFQNRFATALKWAEMDGTTSDKNWIYGGQMNANYFMGENYTLGEYADSTVAGAPGYQVMGFAMCKNGNRITPRVRLMQIPVNKEAVVAPKTVKEHIAEEVIMARL